ncbi:MAG: Fe-S protein assembly co-chaperone HscB [Rhodospirillaceae bacterium]|nr:Fe-S protein assembly co-chaperone HscB [Rhodospirillaceae bacterium]
MDGPDSAADRAPAEEVGIIACWSCKGPVKQVNPLCETCGAVQPPGQMDHYQRLGLAVSFDINVADLDQLYFDLQRHLHPDRFATRSPRERAISQLQATAINDAYETLKEPLTRADYLVHLRGMGVFPEGCNLINDQALLMETMELREALAEAETTDQVDVLSVRAQDDIKVCIEQLSKLFSENDIEGACKLTTRLKYLQKLAEETRIHRMKLI